MTTKRIGPAMPICIALVVGLAIAISLVVTSCRKEQAVPSAAPKAEPLRVAYLPIIPDLPVFVTFDRGLFKKHGLEPSMKKVAGSGNQVLETLSRGDADLGYLAYSTVLEAEQQAPGSFVLTEHNVDAKEYPSLYALVASPQSGIKKVVDLKGKTIGTFPGAAMLVLTKLMLTAEGIDIKKDVKIVQLAPPAQVAALKTKQVDALLALEPNGALAVESGAGEYVDRWPLTPRAAKVIPTGGAVILRKTVADRPEYTQKIVAAMDEAIDIIRSDPKAATAYYVKYCDVSEAVAKDLPVLHFWKSTEIDQSICQSYADLLQQEGVLIKPLNVGTMYLPSK